MQSGQALEKLPGNSKASEKCVKRHQASQIVETAKALAVLNLLMQVSHWFDSSPGLRSLREH